MSSEDQYRSSNPKEWTYEDVEGTGAAQESLRELRDLFNRTKGHPTEVLDATGGAGDSLAAAFSELQTCLEEINSAKTTQEAIQTLPDTDFPMKP